MTRRDVECCNVTFWRNIEGLERELFTGTRVANPSSPARPCANMDGVCVVHPLYRGLLGGTLCSRALPQAASKCQRTSSH